MKRIVTWLAFGCLMFAIKPSRGQDVKTTLNNYAYGGVSPSVADSIKKAIIDSVFANPALYNDAYAKFLASYSSDSSQLFKFIRNLNLKFKTFQTDNLPAALGFEYNYENSWTKSQSSKNVTSFQSYVLSFSGNIAFQRQYNTANLMESALKYNASWLWGGKVKTLDTASRNKLLRLNHAIIMANIAKNYKLMEALYAQRGQFIRTSNQYYLGINGNFSLENSQDFSRRQFVPALLVNLGAKAWDPDDALLYFNIPDYPFALIRLLTGTDTQFSLSGSSFPTALVGIDYVLPGQDSVRQKLNGNLDPYNRFRMEVAFKTKVLQFAGQVVYCSADFRYYHELNPSMAIKNAALNRFNYFAAALEATNGFFVSFTSGRLPFDQKNSNVYGMGFHYNLGNW